jgi:hypothetical protein
MRRLGRLADPARRTVVTMLSPVLDLYADVVLARINAGRAVHVTD